MYFLKIKKCKDKNYSDIIGTILIFSRFQF